MHVVLFEDYLLFFSFKIGNMELNSVMIIRAFEKIVLFFIRQNLFFKKIDLKKVLLPVTASAAGEKRE